jgi:predicted nucleotidyltransferase
VAYELSYDKFLIISEAAYIFTLTLIERKTLNEATIIFLPYEQLNLIKMFSPYEKIILDRLTAVFSAVSDIKQIVVFGSRSRGDSNDGSDLDVLVLVNERDSMALRTIQSLKAKALNDIEDFSYVNVFPVRESEFYSSSNAFHQRVQKEGITIWSRKDLNPSK